MTIEIFGPHGPIGPEGPQGPPGSLGTAVIDDLSDVDTTTSPPSLGDAFIWNGSEWVPGSASGKLIAYKTSDEAKASTIVLSDDAELVIPSVEADSTYLISAAIIAHSASATPDIRLAFAGPSGSSHRWGITPSITTGDGFTASNYSTGSFIAQGVSTIARLFVLRGSLTVGLTTGPFALQWCQNSSNAIATNVLAHSWLTLERV